MFLIVAVGGGEGVGLALSGRRANAKLRAANKALKHERDHLKELFDSITHASGGQSGSDIAALAAQAKNALDDRSEVIGLLNQVQATDRAYPQLPQELREDIDETLRRLRTRVEKKP